MSTLVVYVHGLWQKGLEGAWLRRRLARELGAQTAVFSYPSVTGNVTANARALGRFLAARPEETIHLVGHSLGGLVVLKLFESFVSADGHLDGGALLAPGRIVLMGSPVRGSRAAQRVAKLPLGKKIMGATVHEVLLTTRERRWDGGRELGIIAGDVAFGLGRLVGKLGSPNDGTVLVEETHVEGATEHLRLGVSHSGMWVSALVAKQAAAFLRDGRFHT